MEVEITCKPILDSESFRTFCSLLKAAKLPYEDLNEKEHILLGYYDEEKMIGTGALEIYGKYALLRSLSVQNAIRGQSLGSRITEDLIHEAKKKGLKCIYLLTDTARLFFKRKGFKDIDRSKVPQEVASSSEFTDVCPETAVCMEYQLPEI